MIKYANLRTRQHTEDETPRKKLASDIFNRDETEKYLDNISHGSRNLIENEVGNWDIWRNGSVVEKQNAEPPNSRTKSQYRSNIAERGQGSFLGCLVLLLNAERVILSSVGHST